MSIIQLQLKMSLLIKNGKVFQNGVLTDKNIFIENGKISKITSQTANADQIIDAKGKYVLPGLIDPHVHIREPGLTHKEDFLSGSEAAAAGGVTSFIDMPNTIPPTINRERLNEKRELARKSIINYGFHFGSTSDNVDEINAVEGVAGVKIYMDHTTGDLKIDEYEALKKIFSANKTVLVHAEGSNVLKAKELIQFGNNALYVCHTSSKEELDNAKNEKIKNPVYVEVAPHHLFLSKDDLIELHNYGEMKPNLKTSDDQKALWEGITNGKVDTIGTDHAPHTKEEKIESCPFGVPGLETTVPLMFNAMHEKKITLKKIVELCCENPAKIFKIKNKGFIKEGFDADLAIIDPDLQKEVKNDDLFTKCKWSPFDGWNLKGWPTQTIVNGNLIFDDGKINKIKAKELRYNV